ncbi:hypothetical protein GCM10011495_40400 [Hymenobacter frigidus]|uniref:Bacteriocin n=1 Tax=Hymenobacter frigidus TaxID=1524095 RepID=A0ABQ2ALW5_9BACT|nr:class I lanthipeptide [Hymenobacter frigidus]GGH91706.1 hypothetical protein GCM10011495_40400 [Hymenobacter frigidus]
MKKQAGKLDKVLLLDKETIAKLTDEQLSTLEGGMVLTASITCGGPPTQSCNTCSCND